jgi:hypothetical protein
MKVLCFPFIRLIPFFGTALRIGMLPKSPPFTLPKNRYVEPAIASAKPLPLRRLRSSLPHNSGEYGHDPYAGDALQSETSRTFADFGGLKIFCTVLL